MKKLVLKKILFFIIALLCVSFSRIQEKNIKKNDLEKMNLYGPVKSLREIQYEVIDGKTSTNSRNHQYYMFIGEETNEKRYCTCWFRPAYI